MQLLTTPFSIRFETPGKPEKIKQVNRSITASPPRRSNSESSHCMPRLQAVQTFSVYRPTADDQLSGGGRCASRRRELGTADLVVRLVANLRSLPGDARPTPRTTVLNSRLVPPQTQVAHHTRTRTEKRARSSVTPSRQSSESTYTERHASRPLLYSQPCPRTREREGKSSNLGRALKRLPLESSFAWRLSSQKE